MASPGGVIINFTARTRDAVRDVDRLSRSLQDSGKKARSAGSIMSGALKAGIAGVGIAAVGAGIAFVDMAKAAYADAQAQQKLERNLKRVAGITDSAAEATGAWIDNMELLTLVSDDELRTALGKLALVTEDLTDAQKLSALAADAAVGSGRDFAATATAMAKAAGGNTAALKRLFPQLDAGPDKVLTFEEAISQLKDAYDGAAAAAADNDLFGRLAAAWGQIKEALGSAALPTLEAVSTWFSDPANIKAVQEWITKVGEWSREVGEKFKGKIEDLIDYLGSPEGQNALRDFGQSMSELAGGISEASDQLGPFLKLLGDLIGLYNQIPAPLKGLVGLGAQLAERDSRRPAVTRDQVNAAAVARARSGRSQRDGGAYAAGGTTVNINVNNPKPEPASSSIAAGIRAGKYVDRRTGGF